MNPLLALGVLALATVGGSTALVAPALFAPTCQDLAGQGSACVDAGTGGVDATVILAPSIPPVATALALEPTCQDLAGQGYACADVRDDGFDVEAVLAPTLPPVASAMALDPTCQDLAGRGTACVDGTDVTYDVTVSEIGFSSSGSASVGI